MVIPWIDPNTIKGKNGKFKRVRYNFSPEFVLSKYKEEIRPIVSGFKNHSAIFAWYFCDEPWESELINIGFTGKLIDFTKTLDKLHPVYINYPNLNNDFKFYGRRILGDIVSETQYPIPIYPFTYIAERTGMEYIAGELNLKNLGCYGYHFEVER